MLHPTVARPGGARRLAGAAVLLCAVGVLATTAGPAAAQQRVPAGAALGGGAGKIVYSSDGPLVIRRPDGSGRHSIPRTRYWGEPQWSPNGRWIVAVHGQRATVLRPDGTDRRKISPAPPPMKTRYATSPTWSPDGTRIAYVLQLDTKYEVRIVRRDGSLVKRLTSATKYLPSMTAWSPKGDRIAFIGTTHPNYPSPQWDLFTVRVGSGAVTRLTSSGGADEWNPAWRPDGGRLVYERDYFNFRGSGAVRRELFVVRPSGRDAHSIYQSPDVDSYMESPAYSPNGDWIVFGYRGSNTSLSYGLRIIRANGTGLRQVSKDFGDDPSWR